MNNRIETTLRKRSVRSLTALMLLISLIAIPVTAVQAAEIPPVPTDETAGAPLLRADLSTTAFTCEKPLCDHGHITAYIQDAPEKAWVSVQWLDGSAVWHNVEGWQGNIAKTKDNKPFQQWAVLNNAYGLGPFRWVVYAERGGKVWAVSPNFNLPKAGGLDFTMFLTKQPPPAPIAAAVVQQDLVASLPEASQLKATTTTMAFPCEKAICDHGHITAFLEKPPANGWVAVQWLDASGAWRTVTGWQGNIANTKDNKVQFQQWAVLDNAYGQGPFRWVIYTERDGSVWGVSPSFNMPKHGGLDFMMFLSK